MACDADGSLFGDDRDVCDGRRVMSRKEGVVVGLGGWGPLSWKGGRGKA